MMPSRDTESKHVEIVISPAQHVTVDGVSGALRTFFDPVARPLTPVAFSPRDLALQVLKAGSALFHWQPSLADLPDGPVISGENFSSVRFHQSFKGVPVDAAEVVVNLCGDGRLQSLYSQYRYDIPQALDPAGIKFDQGHARAFVKRLSHGAVRRAVGQPRLIVCQHPLARLREPRRARTRGRSRNRFLDAARGNLTRARRQGFTPRGGHYYLAWEVLFTARRPLQSWRILIDAVTGHLLRIQDLLAYSGFDATGRVFDPNPIITSGDPSLSWSDLGPGQAAAQRRRVIQNQIVDVTLRRLEPPEAPKQYRLHGLYVCMAERDDPKFAEPVRRTPAFTYDPASRKFLDVMTYYHIDSFQEYVQTRLGLIELASLVAMVDPQGSNGNDVSAGSAYEIVFGEGTSPNAPDASDGTIVIHEYAHALMDKAAPGSPTGMTDSGVSEGFADWLAMVYFDDKHKDPPSTRGLWGLWGKSAGLRRSCRVTACFDDPSWGGWDGYKRGEVWSSTLFEIYRKLGGDSLQTATRNAAMDLMIRLHLMANRGVAKSDASDVVSMPAATTLMAQQILGADANLAGWLGDAGEPRYANGLHQKVIRDGFSRRALPEFPPLPVDVYIDDGRKGGYGSVKAKPTFDDSLWLENQGDPPGLWVQEPGTASVTVGAIAQVFARIANLGGTDSGPITVKAFVARPGAARAWPVDWRILDPAAPSQAVGNIKKNPDPGVVIPSFSWTPTETGAHTLLVIVECAQDQAVTELLHAADRVPLADLVPFDNNIAMRDIQVTA